MALTEILLIGTGIAAFAASFFITEKLSQKDLEQIRVMSETDLKLITEKQLKKAKRQLENSVEDIIEESLETTKRGLEKETNEKIMAVSEYSDTVIEEINKLHNEVVFLYSMLNDKQTEAADMVSDLQRTAKQIRDMDLERVMVASPVLQETTLKPEMPVECVQTKQKAEIGEDTEKEEQTLSKNEQILQLYKEGKDEVEIAKTLDCGLGVVRLVLGLYHET